MPKYIIVGGVGLLGSHIAAQLLDREDTDHVFLLDTRDNAESMLHQHEKYSRFWGSRLSLVITDISQPRESFLRGVEETLFKRNGEQLRVTCCFHTASIISMAPLPITHKINVHGTQNIIEMCKKFEIDSLVYTSSSSVIYQPLSTAEAERRGKWQETYAGRFYQVDLDDDAFMDRQTGEYVKPKGFDLTWYRPDIAYPVTKFFAEQMVLQANSDRLRTCAIRACG